MALGVLAIAALSACAAVGPDFVAPQAPTPAAFKSTTTAPGASAVPADWWTIFGDAQLDALERAALADSPTLAAAAARSERARALLGAASADASPRLSADGSAQRFRTSQEVATAPVVLGQPRAIEANQFAVQATLGWELDFWGRVKRQTEVAQAQLDASSAEADTARVLLSADVASSYLQLRALDDEARIVAAARDSRRDALQVVQRRFDAGSTQELDLQRARTELANAQADVAELARRRNLVENGLAVLTGQPPGALRVATGTQALPAVPLVPAGVPSDLLKRRPDIAQSLATLHASSAQIGVAEAAFYPSIRLTGGLGLASSDLGSLISSPARLFSIGPTVSLPLFDGGRNQANLKAAQASQAEALANFRQRVLVALREVDDALGDLQQRIDIASAQTRATQAAERALRVARLRYEQGASSYLEVTDADRSALATERALAQTRSAQWQSTVQLVKALGGGWGV